MPSRNRMARLPYRDPYSTSEIARNNQACGGHFFDRGTLRFFDSRIGESVGRRGDSIYFTTSEKGPDGVRRYTVRVAKERGCRIETAGNFQGYATAAQARLAARRLAGPPRPMGSR